MEKAKKHISYFSLVLGVLLSASMSLSAADDVFKAKCSKCHALKNPDNYTKKDWKNNVERMAQRAGLTPEEMKQIIALNKKK